MAIKLFLGVAGLLLTDAFAQTTNCVDLTNKFKFESTTVIGAAVVKPNATFSVPGNSTCFMPTATNGNSTICRVQLVTNTTSTSSVHMEMWLPELDVWNGRLLGIGNGGLGGCESHTWLA